MIRRSLLAAAATLALAGASHAQSLVLSKPGSYTLQRNIMVDSGDGILITASGVTLNLGGHTVRTRTPGTGRGIVIQNVAGVVVRNGKIGSFNMNVFGENTENLALSGLQITGEGLAPAGGPVEIGIALVSSRAARISDNTISSVNLGLIIRGPGSGGNRVAGNSVVGGATAGHNLLAMCWNPLPGGAATDPGPVGDLVYDNHVSQFQTGFSASPGSKNIVFKGNTISFFAAAFTPATFASAMNNNVDADNIENQIH